MRFTHTLNSPLLSLTMECLWLSPSNIHFVPLPVAVYHKPRIVTLMPRIVTLMPRIPNEPTCGHPCPCPASASGQLSLGPSSSSSPRFSSDPESSGSHRQTSETTWITHRNMSIYINLHDGNTICPWRTSFPTVQNNVWIKTHKTLTARRQCTMMKFEHHW